MPKSSVGTGTVRLRENTAVLCDSVRETLAGGRGQIKDIGLEWPQLGAGFPSVRSHREVVGRSRGHAHCQRRF